MALFEDMFKGAGVSGLAIGIGAAILAPTLLPAIGRIARPAAKAVLKTGISLYRETAGELGQATRDLYQEAQAELATEGAPSEGESGEAPAQGRSSRSQRH
jgi:hypothetical protein